MAPKKSELSKNEWALMKICWKKEQATARVIYEETLKEKQRSYHTIKTMLDRLVRKGYLRREKFGPLWIYHPVISRAKVMAKAIESFAETVLDNTIAPLFAYFSKSENLKPEEIEELKKLIKKGKE